MTRQHHASRAECLLIACAPYSHAFGGVGHLDKSVGLLEDMFTDPWQPGAKGVDVPTSSNGALQVLAAFDREWLKQEGARRLLAAVGLAVLDLAAGLQSHDDALRVQLLASANKLTHAAGSRRLPARAPLPDLQSCIAAVARARYLEECGNQRAALQHLTTPTSGSSRSYSVLDWSINEQLSTKLRCSEQPHMSPRAIMSMSPREARWQTAVVAFALQLQLYGSQRYLVAAPEPCMPVVDAQAALAFGARLVNVPDHPLHVIAQQGSMSRRTFETPEADMPALRARAAKLLSYLPGWFDALAVGGGNKCADLPATATCGMAPAPARRSWW